MLTVIGDPDERILISPSGLAECVTGLEQIFEAVARHSGKQIACKLSLFDARLKCFEFYFQSSIIDNTVVVVLPTPGDKQPLLSKIADASTIGTAVWAVVAAVMLGSVAPPETPSKHKVEENALIIEMTAKAIADPNVIRAVDSFIDKNSKLGYRKTTLRISDCPIVEMNHFDSLRAGSIASLAVHRPHSTPKINSSIQGSITPLEDQKRVRYKGETYSAYLTDMVMPNERYRVALVWKISSPPSFYPEETKQIRGTRIDSKEVVPLEPIGPHFAKADMIILATALSAWVE